MTLPLRGTVPIARAAPIDPIQHPPRVRRRLLDGLITRDRGDSRENERRRVVFRNRLLRAGAVDRAPRREVQRERVVVSGVAVHPERLPSSRALRISEQTARTSDVGVRARSPGRPVPVPRVRRLLRLDLARALPRHRPRCRRPSPFAARRRDDDRRARAVVCRAASRLCRARAAFRARARRVSSARRGPERSSRGVVRDSVARIVDLFLFGCL